MFLGVGRKLVGHLKVDAEQSFNGTLVFAGIEPPQDPTGCAVLYQILMKTCDGSAPFLFTRLRPFLGRRHFTFPEAFEGALPLG